MEMKFNYKSLRTVCCLVVLLVLSATAQAKDKYPYVVIGYVGGYRGLVNTDRIEANKLTHINYAFVNIKEGKAILSNLRTDTVNLRKLNLLKQKNPALQILISIGGWSWSENFSDAVLTDTSRQVFAKSAVDIIRQYALDGVDIDWEYPSRPGEDGNVYRKEDKQNYTLMFQALRCELDKMERETGRKKLLTTAAGGFTDFVHDTEMDKVQQYLDYINLMTYDFYSSTTAGHHTNLYASDLYHSHNDADKTVKAFIAAGVPARKLVMGVAFYGRTFTLTASAQKGIGDTILSQKYGNGFTEIKDSLENKKGFRKYKDEKAKAPYLFNATTKQFITYDDEWSVKNKCTYVQAHQLGGVMFWEYDSDLKGYLLHEIDQQLSPGRPAPPAFRVLAVAENGGHHAAFSQAAHLWLNQLAAEHHFAIDYVHTTDAFSDAYLAQYQLILQLDYPPYAWKDSAMAAFQRYIAEGKGGWVGLHHATLLGDFDGYTMSAWFSRFLGDIRFAGYISTFADGKVNTEDRAHPVMKGIPASFTVAKEEWYTYNKSPRANVHVLASVDESTYQPASTITMGDHPVVWTNPAYAARNVYIFMGHGPSLLQNATYKKLLSNAILWAAGAAK